MRLRCQYLFFFSSKLTVQFKDNSINEMEWNHYRDYLEQISNFMDQNEMKNTLRIKRSHPILQGPI